MTEPMREVGTPQATSDRAVKHPGESAANVVELSEEQEHVRDESRGGETSQRGNVRTERRGEVEGPCTREQGPEGHQCEPTQALKQGCMEVQCGSKP